MQLFYKGWTYLARVPCLGQTIELRYPSTKTGLTLALWSSHRVKSMEYCIRTKATPILTGNTTPADYFSCTQRQNYASDSNQVTTTPSCFDTSQRSNQISTGDAGDGSDCSSSSCRGGSHRGGDIRFSVSTKWWQWLWWWQQQWP